MNQLLENLKDNKLFGVLNNTPSADSYLATADSDDFIKDLYEVIDELLLARNSMDYTAESEIRAVIENGAYSDVMTGSYENNRAEMGEDIDDFDD